MSKQTISHILSELNQDNGQNYKISVLKKYSDHDLFRRVLRMTKDRVQFKYNLSVNRWVKGDLKEDISSGHPVQFSLEDALDFMEYKLNTRELTGNAAVEGMHTMLCGLSGEDRDVILKVLNRDLRINLGKTQINKVFPDLIAKPIYMRCGIYNEKTAKKMNLKNCIVQLKADGTYREFTVHEDGSVTATTRAGEDHEYPLHFQVMSSWPAGHYFGELTVVENGIVKPRSEGNGLINSNSVPHEIVVLDLWDYVTPEEYQLAHQKKKCKIPYSKRLEKLREIITGNSTKYVQLIETHSVSSIREALEHCSRWMNDGFEGAILKDGDSVFRDGTNPQQLKLKLVIEIDVRVTGFQEGTIGTAREKTFGAMEFANDDGLIRGRCSGFTDAELLHFNGRRAETIGKIISVECNDITRGRNNEHYALSHPRFVEVRDDKTETDTLERAFELKEMAMNLGTI